MEDVHPPNKKQKVVEDEESSPAKLVRGSSLKCDILQTAREAGKEVEEQCRLQRTNGPTMLPPVPSNPYIDKFSEHGRTNKEQIESNQQKQQEAEIEVYRALEGIGNDKIKVLYGLTYTHEQFEWFVGEHNSSSKNPKSACKLKKQDTEGECDLVVLIENIVVIFEIKAPEFSGDLTKDDKMFKRNFDDSARQRKRTRMLVEKMFDATDHGKGDLIILDFSIFNHTEKQSVVNLSSYKRKSDDDKSKIAFKEEMSDFSEWWSINIVPHFATTSCTPCTLDLHYILMGVWCMDKENTYNTNTASLAYWIKKIAESLRRSMITRRPEQPVSSNIKGGPAIFKKYLNIECITEPQKSIFNEKEQKCLLISGPAGSGKTVLLLAKIIDLVLNDKTDRKIVLFVQENNVKYYEKVLSAALGSGVNIVKLERGEQDVVDQIKLDNSKQVTIVHVHGDTSSLNNMHIIVGVLEIIADKDYSIFIDELQDYSNLLDCQVAVAVAQLFAKVSSSTESNVVWVACDLMQHYYAAFGLQGEEQWKQLEKIPLTAIRTLTSNLRNTLEIANTVGVMRDKVCSFSMRGSGLSVEYLEKLLLSQETGHYIHGPKPQLYVLYDKSQNMDENSLIEVVTRTMNCELDKLCSVNKHLKCEDIAVIAAGTDSWLKTTVQPFQHRTDGYSNLQVQYIKEPVTDLSKISSMEWPAVMGVMDAQTTLWGNYSFSTALYKIVSRARVHCSLIIVVPNDTYTADKTRDILKALQPFVKITYLKDTLLLELD